MRTLGESRLCLQLTMHCTNITAQKPSDTHGDVPTLIRLSKGEVLAKIGFSSDSHVLINAG